MHPWNNTPAPNLEIWWMGRQGWGDLIPWGSHTVRKGLTQMVGGLDHRPKLRGRTAYSTRCPWRGRGGWYTGLGCAARRPSTWNRCCHTRCIHSGTQTAGERRGKICISICQTLTSPTYFLPSKRVTDTITVMRPGPQGRGLQQGGARHLELKWSLSRTYRQDLYGHLDHSSPPAMV